MPSSILSRVLLVLAWGAAFPASVAVAGALCPDRAPDTAREACSTENDDVRCVATGAASGLRTCLVVENPGRSAVSFEYSESHGMPGGCGLNRERVRVERLQVLPGQALEIAMADPGPEATDREARVRECVRKDGRSGCDGALRIHLRASAREEHQSASR